MGKILYPVGYNIGEAPGKSTEGRDRDFAKAVIRYAVGVEDEPLEDWQLVNLVSGYLTPRTVGILKPLRKNKPALLAKIEQMGIPIVSASLTEEERLDVINRAKTLQDIIGNNKTKSLTKKEVLECIDEVIEERKDTWIYPEVEEPIQ